MCEDENNAPGRKGNVVRKRVLDRSVSKYEKFRCRFLLFGEYTSQPKQRDGAPRGTGRGVGRGPVHCFFETVQKSRRGPKNAVSNCSITSTSPFFEQGSWNGFYFDSVARCGLNSFLETTFHVNLFAQFAWGRWQHTMPAYFLPVPFIHSQRRSVHWCTSTVRTTL